MRYIEFATDRELEDFLDWSRAQHYARRVAERGLRYGEPLDQRWLFSADGQTRTRLDGQSVRRVGDIYAVVPGDNPWRTLQPVPVEYFPEDFGGGGVAIVNTKGASLLSAIQRTPADVPGYDDLKALAPLPVERTKATLGLEVGGVTLRKTRRVDYDSRQQGAVEKADLSPKARDGVEEIERALAAKAAAASATGTP